MNILTKSLQNASLKINMPANINEIIFSYLFFKDYEILARQNRLLLNVFLLLPDLLLLENIPERALILSYDCKWIEIDGLNLLVSLQNNSDYSECSSLEDCLESIERKAILLALEEKSRS